MGKVKNGDGRALKPMRAWQALHRTMFATERGEHRYVVDVRLWDDEAALYMDGRQHATASLPATFPIDGGQIEVASSTYGLKRIHVVPDHGDEVLMQPLPGTAEHWRAELARRHPRASRTIATTAVILLLIGIAVWLPQAAELVTRIDAVAERVGTFTSPVELPGWLTTTLTVTGIAAGIERALTLRNHWLIDLDTFWLG